jgi:hypothetical protein
MLIFYILTVFLWMAITYRLLHGSLHTDTGMLPRLPNQTEEFIPRFDMHLPGTIRNDIFFTYFKLERVI